MSSTVGDYRKLSEDFLQSIDAFKCSRGRFADRIIFPFYNMDNELVGYTGRYVGNSTDKSIPKYLHATGIQPSDHILFGKFIKDMIIDTSTLIVTEGSHDAYHLLQLGIAATPSLGFRTPSDSWVIEAIKLGVDRVILAWDNDNAGIEKMMGIKQSLFNKWEEKIPTTLGIFDSRTKWLYKSNFKDFGEAGELIIGNSSMLQLAMKGK
jgi:DNA primase